MTTLAQYRTAVSGKIGLDNSVAGDQTAIDLWVNEGVTDVILRSKCQMAAATITLTAGTPDYTMDTAILAIYAAYVNTGGIPYWLEFTSVDEILAMRRTTTANVSPAQFYAVGGSNLFLIYPTPASSSDSVTIYYTARPSTLSLSSDSPSTIPSEFHKAVEYYALAQAADYSDDNTSQGGAVYMQQYELWLRRVKKWVAFKGSHRLPKAMVRRNRASIPFHDPSRYPYR